MASPRLAKVLYDAKGLLTKPIYALLEIFRIGKHAIQILPEDQKKLANLLYHARYPESQERKVIKALGKIKPLLDYLLLAAATVLAFSGARLITFPPISITIATTIALSLVSVVLLEILMEVFYSLKEHNRIKTMVSDGILSLDPKQQQDTVLGDLMCIAPTLATIELSALRHDIKIHAKTKDETETARNICTRIKEASEEIKSILFQADDNNLTHLQKHLARKVGSQHKQHPHMPIPTHLDTLHSSVAAHKELVTGTYKEVWGRYIQRREQAVKMQKIFKQLHDKRGDMHIICTLIKDPNLAIRVEEPLPTDRAQRFDAVYAIMVTLGETIAQYAGPATIPLPAVTSSASHTPLSSNELTSSHPAATEDQTPANVQKRIAHFEAKATEEAQAPGADSLFLASGAEALHQQSGRPVSHKGKNT